MFQIHCAFLFQSLVKEKLKITCRLIIFMIISHYYCCFLFIRSRGAQQQPLTSSSDCPGIVPAGFFWRHQLPRPTSLPTIWYRFHLLHEGWTEKQPRGKSYTLGVEGLQVNFGKSTNIATFFFISDLEERWVFLQRPAALSGVPAVLGLARGRRTTPRMDGPPGHQLVPKLLLWRQWLPADRYSSTWSKEAVVCVFAVCGHWVDVLFVPSQRKLLLLRTPAAQCSMGRSGSCTTPTLWQK